jgi:phosphoserine phosphatase RsbU/P
LKAARILVVDDEPGMLRAVERVLGGRHQIAAAATAEHAMALAATFRPELAIVDIRMPDQDGFELMNRLKREHRDLDVILMTGSVSEPDRKLVRAIREDAFYFIQKPFDSEVLRTLVDRCLAARALTEANRSHVQTLERELSEARWFQQSLLPPTEAVIGSLRLDCRSVSCSLLAGDLYDYVALSGGGAALLVADVSGHGVSAAMLTGIVKSSFRSSSIDQFDPLAVVERIWLALGSFDHDRFVSAFAAVVNEKERRLDYVNAGHPAPLMWTAHAAASHPGIVALDSTGPILSPAIRKRFWEKKTTEFQPGSRLLAYTDGISEAVDPEGDFFGEERIHTHINTRLEGGATLVAELLQGVERFSSGRPQPDDLTVLAASLD